MRIFISAFNIVKRYLFKRKLGKIGTGFFCSAGSRILLPKDFSCGDNVFIGPDAYIVCIAHLESNVMLGPKVTILGGSHNFAVKGQYTRFLKADPQADRKVTIGNDTWIGSNVTIVGPLEIGFGAVVGANSLVSKDIPPFTVNVGNPSKSIKKIFTDESLKEHLLLLGYSEDFALSIITKRNAMLSDIVIPFLDNTEKYWEFGSD